MKRVLPLVLLAAGAAVGVVLLALLVWLLGDDETPVGTPEQIVETRGASLDSGPA